MDCRGKARDQRAFPAAALPAIQQDIGLAKIGVGLRAGIGNPRKISRTLLDTGGDGFQILG